MLAVLVGERLAHGRLRARLVPAHHRRHRAQPDQAQHLGLDVERGELLAHGGVGDAAVPAHDVEDRVGRRPPPPERPFARERDPLVAEGDLGESPAVVLLADDLPFRDADAVEEHLVEHRGAVHLPDRPHGDPWCAHVDDEVRDAAMLLGRRVRAREEDPVLGDVGKRGPHFLAVHDVLVAIALGAGRQRGEIAAGAGLAEELAPELGAGEDAGEVALLLRPRAGHEQRRPGPADADRVHGSRRASGAEPFVDHELLHRAGVETEGLGPVRGDVPRFGELHAPVGRESALGGVLAHEGPDFVAVGLGLRGQIEVHRPQATAGLARCSSGLIRWVVRDRITGTRRTGPGT